LDGQAGTLRPVLPTTDPRSSWKLTDSAGTVADRRAIENAVEIVRMEHRYVDR
jgi:hypothetical protein